jgi:hypothetical protein
MKKSELKTGMKIVTRDKDEYIVFKDFEHNWDESDEVLMSNKANIWMPLSDYNEDLKSDGYFNDDIIEVYKPSHVYTVGNFFGANNVDKTWYLVWKREEKKDIKEEPAVMNYTINISIPSNMDINKISELISNELEKAKYNY